MSLQFCRRLGQASFIFFAVLLLTLLPVTAQAAERIDLFESDIRVLPDGKMKVREDITVNIRHEEIRHGIFRDFPTSYKDASGHVYRVGFDVENVLFDGSPVSYKVSRRSNGVRIQIGDADKWAPRGKHTYSIYYETSGQLSFFKDHDELYWNATGNGWKFPIERAVAHVTLPEGVPAREITWYTGPQGSRDRNAEGTIDGNSAAFSTTNPLGSGEGLTIAVAFDKGFFTPSPEQVALAKRSERSRKLGTTLPVAALLLVLLYFLLAWHRHGRDGRKTVIPLFYPPDKLLPADGSYLYHQGYREQALTATLLDLAVRGFLTIEEIAAFSPLSLGSGSKQAKPGSYRLVRTPGKQPEDPRESYFLADLFEGGGRIDLKHPEPLQREAVQSARKGLMTSVKETCKGLLRKNHSWSLLGLLLTLVLLGGAGFIVAWGEGTVSTFLFSGLWLSLWTVGITALVFSAFTTLSLGIRQREGKMIFRGAFLTLFSVPFMGGEVMGLSMAATSTSLAFSLCLITALAVNVLFFKLMKSYSPAGRMMMDRVEGFRMYMETAESERIRAMASMDMPEDTPERFEQLLPWALALGVEKQWASRFEEILLRTRYEPVWYQGTTPWHMAGSSLMTSGLTGGLGEAISSAATSPGSSSGFGGGGSSGGGGGGGGGGGW